MGWFSGQDAKFDAFYVDMGGTKIAFKRKRGAIPDDLLKALGIIKANDTTDNLVWEIAKGQRPPQVAINCAGGKRYKVYCDPSKIEALTQKGSANGMKYHGKNINSVRMVHN